MPARPRVVIIGAGAGGLAAAASLARSHETLIFERASEPGGKIHQRPVVDGAIGDGAIDAGPTVFTMKWVFDDLFRACGAAFDEAVTLTRLDTIANHFWRDGSRLALYADKNRTAEAIAAFASREDARNYLRFCDKAKQVYETLLAPFILAPEPSFLGLLMKKSPLTLSAIDPYSTLWAALGRRFRDPRLRQLFARYATYCGSSPFMAPATLMLIAHVEREGVWLPEGGVRAVATALADLAATAGAQFHYGVGVARILTRDGRCGGVLLDTGERVDADAVIFNGDPNAIAGGLLGEAAKPAAKATPASLVSQSAITWTAMIKRPAFDLSVHNVFFSDHYEAEFDAVFRRGRVPDEPTTYLYAPDRAQAGAPDARERLFCLINAPPLSNAQTYPETEIARCRDMMSRQLSACGLSLTPIEDSVTSADPSTYAAMFPGSRGALYGMANHGWRAAFQKPGARTALKNLYLAGGGAHPGPGVPMATLSGRAAAAAIIADHAST